MTKSQPAKLRILKIRIITTAVNTAPIIIQGLNFPHLPLVFSMIVPIIGSFIASQTLPITSKNEIADIVKGRNDKLSVKRIDIFNQDSSSNDIKALLKNTSFYDNICFKTNTVGKNVKFMNVLELLYRFNKNNISFTEDTGMADNVNNTKTTSSITLFERTICAKRNFEFYKKNWKFYKTMFTLFEKFDQDCNKYLRAERF